MLLTTLLTSSHTEISTAPQTHHARYSWVLFVHAVSWSGRPPFGLSQSGEDEGECHLLEKSQTGEWALDPDSWPCGEAFKRFLEPFPVSALSKGQLWSRDLQRHGIR